MKKPVITSVSALILSSLVVSPFALADEDSTSTGLSDFVDEVVEESDKQMTLYYRNFQNEGYFEDSFFALGEMMYEGEDYTLDMGVALQTVDNKGLFLNHLSYAVEEEDYDYKIGKFVTKVGVMDFLSFVDVFNTTRLEYYDDNNVNIRYTPSWMAKIDVYPDENSTFGLYVKPYDENENFLLGESIQYGLNSVLPYLITNTGDANLDLIGEQVLLPVYEKDAKPEISRYLLEKLPDESISLDNTSLFLNYVVTEDNYTFGAIHSSAYSSFPVIQFDQDLTSALDSLNQADREAYLETYLADDSNEPISSVEYFRYNQFALYYESSVGQLGYRAEISYRDKFPLVNRTTGMFTVGFGLDHQDIIYNNLEVQYSQFEDSDLSAYYVIWLAKTETVKWDTWEVGAQNIATYGEYQNNDIFANFTGIRFIQDPFEIAIEYLTHSKQEYADDTLAFKLKVALWKLLPNSS